MPDRFDEFWEMALRKVGKGAARKAYRRACKRADEAAIMDAWGAANRGWLGKDLQFVPHPATWLNQDRWEDEGPVFSAVNYEKSLQIRANHINSRICEFGAYSQEDLMECVEAGLVTLERAREVGL